MKKMSLLTTSLVDLLHFDSFRVENASLLLSFSHVDLRLSYTWNEEKPFMGFLSFQH
jgi:hypothetical protein